MLCAMRCVLWRCSLLLEALRRRQRLLSSSRHGRSTGLLIRTVCSWVMPPQGCHCVPWLGMVFYSSPEARQRLLSSSRHRSRRELPLHVVCWGDVVCFLGP